MNTNTMTPVYPEDVVSVEYARLGFVRRWVLRWVSPDMADAAKHLSRNRRPYTYVPVMPNKGPLDTLVSDFMNGRGRG